MTDAMPAQSTKDRILAAAETLFADTGFSGTSLRQLTRHANVNLAAVNYHFGSKDNLIREVFRSRLDALYQRRAAALDELEARQGEQPTLEDVLRAFILPAMAISAGADDPSAPFVKVLARAFVEYREELRAFLSERYGDLNSRFFHAIARCLDALPPEEIFARIDFMIGALTYAMADFGVSKRPPEQSQEAYLTERAERLVAFAAAGLRAPHPSDGAETNVRPFSDPQARL